MPRETLIQLINGNLIIELISILIVYFAVDWVIFKLIFQILGVEKKFQKLLPGILLVVLYNTCGKQILPVGLAYSLTLVGILVITIKVIAKNTVSWMQAFWSSFLAYVIVGFGAVLIEYPVFSVNPEIARFITTTPLGIAVGTILCEGIIPLVALFLLKTVDISIIPPVRRKINLLDLANLYLFAGMFSLLYNNSMQLLKNIETSPRLDLIKGIINQLFITLSLIVVYYFVYKTTKNQRDRERRQFEDKITRLERENQELEGEKSKLASLYEQVKSNTIEPKEAIDTVQHIIEKLQNSVVKQQESYKNDSIPALDGNNDPSVKIHLTKRERQVLELLACGLLNKQIADKLGIAETWVNNIVKHISDKAKVSGKLQLVIFAIQNKLVDVNAIKLEDFKDLE